MSRTRGNRFSDKDMRKIKEAMSARWINVPGLLTIAAVLGLWEAAVQGGWIAFDYLPAPSGIIVALAGLVRSGQLFIDIAHTLRSVLIGWTIASVIGIGLGLLLGFSGFARRYSMATVEVLRPMPGVAFLPLALLVFNFSLETELAVIIYPALWPIMINTMGGVVDVAARLHDVGRTLHLTRAQSLGKVLIPAAAPAILVGARLSLGVALVMAIIAEMIGNPQGLGHAIIRDMQAFQPEKMFANVFVVGFLGIALNASLLALSRWAFPGLRGQTHG
jgi:ABC-type nitrate/sulfonate/bicarbonate transport system permease component